MDAAESSLFDLILGGLCDHAVLSLRSTFSMQILTLMATRSLAHSPSIVDLDYGRSSRADIQFMSDSTGRNHPAQNYTCRSRALLPPDMRYDDTNERRVHVRDP